jgi:hypothetical protein
MIIALGSYDRLRFEKDRAACAAGGRLVFARPSASSRTIEVGAIDRPVTTAVAAEMAGSVAAWNTRPPGRSQLSVFPEFSRFPNFL